MGTQTQILIIGLGNTLRGDDAVGRIAAQRVRCELSTPEIRVIDQVGPTPELAAEIAAASLVVFIDASLDGPSDRVMTRRLAASGTDDALAHQLAPAGLLRLAEQLYDRAPEAYAVTIQGQSFDFDDCRLSSAVSERLPEIFAAVRQLVESHSADAESQ